MWFLVSCKNKNFFYICADRYQNLMKTIKTLALALALAFTACGTAESPRTVEDFNFDWKFRLGDDTEYASASFDDSDWRSLHLPHDWAVEGEFSLKNPSTPSGGALPGGIGWYRKQFDTPAGVKDGKLVYVEFDGVFMNSTVYVNGKEFGTRPYGYSSFSYDITEALNSDGTPNTIAVRCDNADQPNSRWYAGCGIYRNVRLVTVNPAHVAYNGVYVTTPDIKAEKACVHVEAEVEGNVSNGVSFKIFDARGKDVAFAEGGNAGGGLWTADLEIANPHLWDIDDTYRYSIVTYVLEDKAVSDAYTQKFGIRTTAWDTDKGFFLNGRPVKLLGVCLHHDMGALGSAVHRRALEREMQIMKDMGVNALRTSHNPPAPELLDICDELGILVMDEAMDMWRMRKTRYDYSRFFDEWHERDVQDFVKRDRNHPSIIMWSIGNEIPEQSDRHNFDLENLTPEQANYILNFNEASAAADPAAVNPNRQLAKHMSKLIRDLDDTRAITSGCNHVNANNNIILSGGIDVIGINYHPEYYDSVRVWYPGIPIIGSETVSSLNSRGVYFQPSTAKTKAPRDWRMIPEEYDFQLTSYDAYCAAWANFHEEAWLPIKNNDWVAGTYIWTGFDYLGEPTPYPWSARSSYFGIVDLAGFPKDSYYLYRSEWTKDTVLHLFPHWNWKDGQEIDVWAYYNNADEVELFLNGKSLGRRSKTDELLHAEWLSVPFEAGAIEVVSYKDGKEVARDRRETTGPAVALRLTPDRKKITADGYDLSYITVEAVDAEGRTVPTAGNMLHFEVKGAGELVGIDNGNAADTLCLKGRDKALFSGKALAIVRSVKDNPGRAVLSVTSENLKGAETTVTSNR